MYYTNAMIDKKNEVSESDPNPIVSKCDTCGAEIRQEYAKACGKSNCPTELGAL